MQLEKILKKQHLMREKNYRVMCDFWKMDIFYAATKI